MRTKESVDFKVGAITGGRSVAMREREREERRHVHMMSAHAQGGGITKADAVSKLIH